MNLAAKFLGQEKIQRLDKAYDMASTILNTTQNPQEALQKAGVSRADLEKAKGLLNNPFAGMVAKVFGTTKEDMQRGLERVESMLTPLPENSQAEQAPVSELERLQNNLSRLT